MKDIVNSHRNRRITSRKQALILRTYTQNTFPCKQWGSIMMDADDDEATSIIKKWIQLSPDFVTNPTFGAKG